MVPVSCLPTAPVPPSSYQHAVAKRTFAQHTDAVTLVPLLHLLTLCRLAIHLA